MKTPYDEFLNKHGGRHRTPSTFGEQTELVEDLQNVIACGMASAIDAGSERDAINEDEELRKSLFELVEAWVELKE